MTGGLVATAIKQVLTICLVASNEVRARVELVGEDWDDLVAEVQAEQERGKRPDAGEQTSPAPGEPREAIIPTGYRAARRSLESRDRPAGADDTDAELSDDPEAEA